MYMIVSDLLWYGLLSVSRTIGSGDLGFHVHMECVKGRDTGKHRITE